MSKLIYENPTQDVDNQDDQNQQEKKTEQAGYCKPPASKRFQKGMSGNPQGRPRHKQKTLYDSIQQELMKSMLLSVNGKKERMPRVSAMVLKCTLKCMAGDDKAFLNIMNALKVASTLEQPSSKAKTDGPRGGVMVVPAIMDINEWEKHAMAQQEQLQREAQEAHEETGKANGTNWRPKPEKKKK